MSLHSKRDANNRVCLSQTSLDLIKFSLNSINIYVSVRFNLLKNILHINLMVLIFIS